MPLHTDVLLARTLDDNTAQIISSFIFFNHNDILRHITGDDQFLDRVCLARVPTAIDLKWTIDLH